MVSSDVAVFSGNNSRRKCYYVDSQLPSLTKQPRGVVAPIENSVRRKYNTRKQPSPIAGRNLLFWHLNLARADGVDDVVRGLTVNRAANRLCCAEDLLRTVSEGLGKGL